ncbi:Arc family DNA-binding protein [Gemella sp. ND 6198]|nr:MULTISPECIES: Arc family DNA-binding protein [unclassified Gemella]AXI27293.1 Arc family DNA-binding protein [Gemella sp. ND 6198]
MAEIYQYPLKIDKELIDKLREIAKENGRSLNKEIEFIIRQYLKEQNS